MSTLDTSRSRRAVPRSSSAPLTIVEVMTAAPHTVDRDERLARAYDLMREHGLRHLPVLDGGELVGVLSQRDLFFLEGLAGVGVRVDKVSEAMTNEVYVVAPGDRVTDVARSMGERKLGCAIVVDRGSVVGLFTATDALLLLADLTS